MMVNIIILGKHEVFTWQCVSEDPKKKRSEYWSCHHRQHFGQSEAFWEDGSLIGKISLSFLPENLYFSSVPGISLKDSLCVS